ncbi:MAG: extracellular solute-binding protein [Sphingomonas bacterium]|nr:ABC transporter substrate-binding protein [Sphingomonas bacterium]MDB5688635.1 extracellular solute-binding protein [Sphingomonas bacterium]
MRPARALLLLAAAAAALGGCRQPAKDGPIDVSAIGAAPALRDANRAALQPNDRVLLGAVAQGLVRFDGNGQIDPGVARRWAVSDDGLYYTFRIDAGGRVDAGAVAASLRRAIGRASRNALKPVLGAIDEIVAVTPEVVEIRLHAPRPNLLQLLAQPELALRVGAGGAGPFRITARDAHSLLLAPVAAEPAAPGTPIPGEVRLWAERAALAIARFGAGRSSVVLGGSFNDLPILRQSRIDARLLRIDPVSGLFGLTFADTSGFAGSSENRRALAMAIDRERLTAAFDGAEWRSNATLLPPGVADLPTPARPDWIDTPLDARQALARATVARWTEEQQGAAPTIRIALPVGPGANLLFAALRRDWRGIGVRAERVAPDSPADVRLIDAVAPADVASWYLRRFTCDLSRVCSEEADALLIAARDATTLAERAGFLAGADARLTAITAFVPLAMPLRWSLAEPGRIGLQPNARGIHPLDHLRGR